MTDAEFIEGHDQQACGTAVGVNYYLAEPDRRRNDRHSRRMLRLTWIAIAEPVRCPTAS